MNAKCSYDHESPQPHGDTINCLLVYQLVFLSFFLLLMNKPPEITQRFLFVCHLHRMVSW